MPRGTKTWQNRRHASTIDLMLASEALASTVLTCKIHGTGHGSDHRVIETTFDVWNYRNTSSNPDYFSKMPLGQRVGNSSPTRCAISHHVAESNADRPSDASGDGSGQCAYTQSHAIPIREAMLDQGFHEAPPSLHVQEGQGSGAATRRGGTSCSSAKSSSSGQGVPRRHTHATETALK